LISTVRKLISAVRERIVLARAKRVVTLDIDSTAIRLLETRGGRVTKWASVALEPDNTEGEIFSNPQALSSSIRQLMASSGVKARKAIVSLSGLYSVSRILTVPIPPAGTATQQAILEAVNETMPVNTDELYLSWRTITASEGVQQVLVVGVPRDVTDTEVRALRAAGVNPYLLDLRAMALARVVHKEQALVLNIEPSNFDIVTVVDGIPKVMRTIAWQQDDLAVEDKAEHLATTLELTVDFYNSHYPDASLDSTTPIFITGQMSGDPALMEKLQARLRYPFESLTPPLEYPAHLPISQYATNIGLVMKEKAPAKNLKQGEYLPPDINLLPEIYKPWKPSARQIYFALGIVAALALTFYLYQATADARATTANLEERYTILNNELQRRQLEIKRRVPLQTAIKEYRTILAMDGNFTEDLRVINSQAEEVGVQVQSIKHEGESIAIDCQADSYILFREYLAALEASGRFSSPIPPPEGYPFTTSGAIKLEPKTGE